MRFTFKDFIEPIYTIKKEMIILFFYVLLATTNTWILTYSLKPIIDSLQEWNYKTFLFYLFFVLTYSIITILYIFINRNVFPNIDVKVAQFLVSKYFNKFILKENIFIENQGTGRMIDIMKTWIDTWSQLTILIFFSMMMSLFFTITGLINIFILSKILFIGLLLWILIFISLVVLFNKKLFEYRKIWKEISVEYTRNIVKVINSKFEILQNDKIDNEIIKTNKILYDWKLNEFELNRYLEYMFSSLRIFILVMRIWTIWFVGYMTSQWKMEPSSLITLITAIGIIDITLMFFIDNYKNLFKSMVHINKFWDIIQNWPEIIWYKDWKIFKFEKWNIELKNISFEYEWKKVLQDFNLKIEWWKKTALIWKSWVWKTTIAKLICGYIRQTNWDIIIDNQNLSELSLKSFYKEIGYLTQEASLFDWTIKENLLYSIWKEVSSEEIEDAIKKSKCEFIYNFDKWLDTEIWERWIMLSWWQKQRLSIAKIFLKNPKILILDEPTSALDSFSEKEITNAIHNLMQDRTMIIIAHRLQTIKECDKIYVIWNNKILEEWTHETLIKQNKTYKEMVDLQSWTINE